MAKQKISIKKHISQKSGVGIYLLLDRAIYEENFRGILAVNPYSIPELPKACYEAWVGVVNVPNILNRINIW